MIFSTTCKNLARQTEHIAADYCYIIMKELKKYFKLLKETGSEFAADNALKLSASLAYYTVFSLGPLLLVVVSVAGLFFEDKEVMWKVYWQLKDLVGQNTADQLIQTIISLQDTDAGFFGMVGIAVLIFGATTVFADMQDSINYIWSIKAKPVRGWLKYLKNRLLSFSLVISIAFLLIVSLLVSSVIDIMSDKLFSGINADFEIVFQVINMSFVFLVITILFAVIYKLLPDAKIKWSDCFKGAFFTGLLFMLGKYVISLYIGSSEMTNTYGAAASIVILLSWVYYTSAILYFGAEFTKVYANHFGGKIQLADNAVYIIKKESEELPEIREL